MSIINVNMKKTMSITIAVLLTLSIIGVAIPTMFVANAGSIGTIEASDSTISGGRVIKIVLNDPDISSADADMPSITSSTKLILDTDGNDAYTAADTEQPGNLLPTYQITGGSWVGFITIATDKPAVPATASFPAQQALGPGGVPGTGDAGTADNALTGGLIAEPNIRFTSAAIDYRDIIAQATNTVGSAGTADVTLTYNDADPAGSVSVTITVDTVSGALILRDGSIMAPGASARVQITDMDLNLNPLAADTSVMATALAAFPVLSGAYNHTFVDSVTADGNYTAGEPIILDTDGDGRYDVGETVVLGTAPDDQTAVSIFPATDMFADTDANGNFTSGEAIVQDKDASGTLNPHLIGGGDLLIVAGTGLTTTNLIQIGIATYGAGVTPGSGQVDGYPTLTESGPNTGIFRGSVTVDAGTAPPTQVLSVSYSDAANAAGDAGSASTSAVIQTVRGSVSLDKSSYIISDYASITVVDPDLNLSPTSLGTTAATPATGVVLTAFPTTHRYVDTDASVSYTAGEPIYLDSSTTVSTADTLIVGTAADVGTATVAFVAGASTFETFIDTDASGAYTAGEAIITDTDTSLTWTDGDAVLLAGFGSIINSVTVKSTSDPDFGFLRVLTETGINTGEFSKVILFTFGTGASSGPVLNVASGNIISVSYMDAASSTSSTAASLVTTATFATKTGDISLDSAVYSSPYSTATVTLVDPDLNTNSQTIQSINPNDDDTLDANEARVGSTTDTADTRDILLTETGVNTDTFTGQFTFSLAAGSSATDQPVLLVANGDLIKVLYRDAADGNGNAITWAATAVFSTTTSGGTAALSKPVYSPGETIVITVTDPDLNSNGGVKQSYAASGTLAAPAGSRTYVIVTTSTGEDVTGYSATDGVTIQLTETGPATGVFTGTHTLLSAAVATSIINVYYQDASDSAGNADSVATPYAVDAVGTVTVNTGSLSTDKTVYTLGETIIITVTDPDRNTNPYGVNNIDAASTLGIAAAGSGNLDVQTTTSGANGAIKVALTETDINTGIFVAQITTTLSSSTAGSSVSASRGDTVTFTYHDELNAGGIAEDRTATASILATTATVTLDKEIYHMTANVEITVYDPDMNTSPDTNQAITGLKVYTTTVPSGIAVGLTETGPDTSTFTATFQIGLPTINVNVGDSIWAQYTDLVNANLQRNALVQDTASVIATTGILEFDMANYQTTDTAKITLTDMDLNRLPSAPETYSTMQPTPGGAILVTSDSDSAGIVVAASETDANTGIFTVSITFTTGTSSGTSLKAAEGDTITATYRDWTPTGVTVANIGVTTKDVTESATLGTPTPELPITTGTPELQDANGNVIFLAPIATPVLLSTTLSNTGSDNQPTLYIVQVKDSSGTVVYIGTASLTIPGGFETDFSVSWTPTTAGSYTVEVFAWESWTSPAPLSEVGASSITAA